MTRTTLITKPPHDNRPNADLKPGDYILIREWCREKAMVPVGISLMGLEIPHPSAEPVTNTSLFGVLLRLEAAQYPTGVFAAFVPPVNAGKRPDKVLSLDLRDFNCERATPEFAAAVLASGARGRWEWWAKNYPPVLMTAAAVAAIMLIVLANLFGRHAQ